MDDMKIAIIGAGIAGLTAAIALRRAGVMPEIYEQAPRFGRVGAAINLTPNAVRALEGLGIGPAIHAAATRPRDRVSRTWDTGAVTSRLPLDQDAVARYGAPTLALHRADLMQVLKEALPEGPIHFGKRLIRLEQTGTSVVLHFEDGSSAGADAVLGADGIHSVVHEHLFGAESPRFAHMVAYRAVVPAAPLRRYDLDGFTKWWGPVHTSQLVTFPLHGGRDLFVFATLPEASAHRESWSTSGRKEDLQAGFAGYAREAQDIVAACDELMLTALYERDPLPHWTRGRVTLLGDACHPMMPFMAQGAAMGIEDAVLLARLLETADAATLPAALARYEALRRPRASRIQLASRENEWLRTGISADWVYGYNAWEAPLEEAEAP